MSTLISATVSIRDFFKAEEYKLFYSENNNCREWQMKGNRTYLIPGYQRAIRWKPKNVRMLLDDVREEKKFLGNILLSTKIDDEYEIIDGQQRLTVILMILSYIKKKHGQFQCPTLCILHNITFEKLLEAINSDFCFEGQELALYEESDVLNQRNDMKALWEEIKGFLSGLDDEDKELDLGDNLLDSKVNILISQVEAGDNSSKKVCVDYFIDINNKSVQLDCTDILKAYAFKEGFDNASQSWEIIQKNETKLNNIVYPKDAMFLHYFLCCANSKLEYKLTSLYDDFKIKRTVNIGNKEYLPRTDIEILLRDKRFYVEMLERIIRFQEFLLTIKNDSMSPSEQFKQYLSGGEEIKPITIDNVFSILCSIIHNTDVVPKLLVMKYFLYMIDIDPVNRTKKNLKTIYWINVLATCFSASKSNRKATDTLSKYALMENWIELVENDAYKKLEGVSYNIAFGKDTIQNGEYSSSGGKYLYKRVAALTTAYKKKRNGEYKYNEELFKDIMSAVEYDIEHFLVNDSCTYLIKNNTGERSLNLPSKDKHFVSRLGNFLYIKKTTNDKLQTHIVKEKIRIVQEDIDSIGENNIFKDKLSKYLFKKIKEVFGDGLCPRVAMDTPIEEIKNSACEYYESEAGFKKEYEQYVKRIDEDPYKIS